VKAAFLSRGWIENEKPTKKEKNEKGREVKLRDKGG
jgi:hypothetical protein